MGSKWHPQSLQCRMRVKMAAASIRSNLRPLQLLTAQFVVSNGVGHLPQSRDVPDQTNRKRRAHLGSTTSPEPAEATPDGMEKAAGLRAQSFASDDTGTDLCQRSAHLNGDAAPELPIQAEELWRWRQACTPRPTLAAIKKKPDPPQRVGIWWLLSSEARAARSSGHATCSCSPATGY